MMMWLPRWEHLPAEFLECRTAFRHIGSADTERHFTWRFPGETNRARPGLQTQLDGFLDVLNASIWFA